MRTFIGLLAGIVVGLIVQAGAVYLASLAVEMPTIGNISRDQIAQAYAGSSTAALVSVVASYFLGGLAAAWVGAALGRRAWVAWTAGGVVALMALIIAVYFPDPAWAQIGAFAAAMIGALFGKHLGAARLAAADASAAEAGTADAAL